MNVLRDTVQTSIGMSTFLIIMTDGFNKVAEVALATFDIIAEAFAGIPASLGLLHAGIRSFADISGLCSLAMRLREWTELDENGKWKLGQEAWGKIAITCSLTVANIGSLFKLLQNFRLIELGQALFPIQMIINASYIIACTLDFIDNALKIHNKPVGDIDECLRKKKLWESQEKNRSDGFKHKANETIIKLNTIATKEGFDEEDRASALSRHSEWEITLPKGNNKNKFGQNREQCIDQKIRECAELNREKWRQLIDRNNPDEIEAFCQKRIQKWDAKLYNHNLAQKRAWIAIAFDIAFVALVIFGTVLAILSGGAPLAIAILALVASTFDLSTFVLYEFCKNKIIEKTLPEIKITPKIVEQTRIVTPGIVKQNSIEEGLYGTSKEATDQDSPTKSTMYTWDTLQGNAKPSNVISAHQ